MLLDGQIKSVEREKNLSSNKGRQGRLAGWSDWLLVVGDLVVISISVGEISVV